MLQTKYLTTVFLFIVLVSCKNEVKTPVVKKVIVEAPVVSKSEVTEKIVDEKPVEAPAPKGLIYPFQKTKTSANLTDLIAAPQGYQRITVASNSFAEWLRYLPAKAKSEKVKLYNGSLKPNQNVHYAILDIDVGKRDLQQCADAVMRLRAEYHYGKKDFSKIHFNFTSGDRVAFEDWSKGKKPKISGNKVNFSAANGQVDTSYPNFRKYMTMIFNYAGTASLSNELKSVPIENMQIGDVFIQGGFPGHAVIVMDIVENTQGDKQFMLAQSYMPAQDIHILKNYESAPSSPWYPIDFGTDLNTPEWNFRRSDLKRFQD